MADGIGGSFTLEIPTPTRARAGVLDIGRQIQRKSVPGQVAIKKRENGVGLDWLRQFHEPRFSFCLGQFVLLSARAAVGSGKTTRGEFKEIKAETDRYNG